MHLTKADGKQQHSTSQFYEGNKSFIFNYAERFMGLAICVRPCTWRYVFREKYYCVLLLQFIPPVQTYSPLPYFQSLLNFVFVSLHQCIVIFCSGLHLMSKWMEQWNVWIHIPTILFQAIYKCRKTKPYWFMLQRKPSKTFRNILKQNLESRESKYTEWTLSVHQVH